MLTLGISTSGKIASVALVTTIEQTNILKGTKVLSIVDLRFAIDKDKKTPLLQSHQGEKGKGKREEKSQRHVMRGFRRDLTKDRPLVISEKSFFSEKNCVEFLMPTISKMFEEVSGLTLKDVELIAIDVGPGGLTGIKIGVTTAKTLAQFLRIPVVSVSSLLALSFNCTETKYNICCLIKCSRTEFFCALYKDSSLREPLVEERLFNISNFSEIQQFIKKNLSEQLGMVVLVGDGIPFIKDYIGKEFNRQIIETPETMWYPRASIIGSIGILMALSGKLENYLTLVPNYLCLPRICKV